MDAVGVTFACPRCSTKLTLALKCACISCGGPLSFEVDHIGHTIQCGHCEGNTPLMPSAIVVGDTPAASEPEPEQSQIPSAATQPMPAKKPKAAGTQPMLVRKPDSASKATGGTSGAPKRPAPPKRPGGAGGVGGPTAPVPQHPDGSGASGPPRRPAGEGVSGPPKRPEPSDRSSGPAPPKRPGDSGAPAVSEGSPPKRPVEGGDSAVPEGVKPPGQAPAMPKMGGGPGDASSGPPKRPAAVAEPQKQGGVSSPAQAAAASREAALAKSKEAAMAASEAAEGEETRSEEKEQHKSRISIAFFVVTLLAGLAWYAVMPYFGWGGDDRFVKARRNLNVTVFRPVFDASAIKVDPASLSISTGEAGLTTLKGKVKNGGKESARNIKITLEVAGGAEPLAVAHTVNQEVKPGQTFEFSTLLSFDVPENAQITVKTVEIH